MTNSLTERIFPKADQEIALDAQSRLWLWRSPEGLPEQLATHLQQALPWEQPEIQIYGRWHRIPRLQCWCGDPGADYRYSGQALPRADWTPPLQQLRQLTISLTGHPYNSALLNLYRHGDDAMGWHADDEPELGPEPWIASWSLGQSRDFVFRAKGASRIGERVTLNNGDLLLMSPAVQKFWQHALPRRKRLKDWRINLTFRQIQTPTLR